LRSFQILRLGLDPPRPKLYERINQRVLDMFAAGLVEETKALLQKYGPSARPLASIGYRETVQLLKGEITKDAAIAAVQQAHRNYAKRQMTWFRREREVHWLTGFGSEPEMQQQASVLLERRK
jgi:tRNA dimethylallyltransferase